MWAIRIGIVLSLLFAIGHAYGVTLWDWIKLLIVPAVIAAGGLWFNAQQRDREQKLANEHAQDEALQANLDQMLQLLLDKDTQLSQSKEGDEARTFARAWTLTVLRRLDGLRKRSVVQFLYESRLMTKDHVALDLMEANLHYADLTDANLIGAHLHGVRLVKAKLNATKLCEADLSGAILFGANLHWAKLHGPDVSRTGLMSDNTDSIPFPRTPSTTKGYTFHNAGPKNADLSEADLSGADLTDAYVTE